ncbi:MAG: hypothetical protein J6T40_10415 [Clostridiales bacterium]|jgi:hypothetical protein|nr:hypothetical protein [Clostridiales bacterium]
MYYTIFGIIIIALGIFQVACPKYATKKDQRDDPKAVSLMRKKGFIVIAIGIAVVLLGSLM